MDRLEWVKWGTSFLGSGVTFVFGGWPQAMAVLLFAVVLDFATGIFLGSKTGTLKSKIGYIGIKRKVLIFVMVAVGHMCDTVLGDTTKEIAKQFNFANFGFIKEGHVIRDTIIYFYLFNEWLSITENAAKAGLPVPLFIRKMIAVLKPGAEGEDSNGKV